jgi:hypothetical protein
VPVPTTAKTPAQAPQLHQINAVLTGYKPQAERRFTTLHQSSTKTPLWTGQQRMFQPYDDDDRGEPGKAELVQIRAPEVLADARAALGKLFDLQLTQDTANCAARADVVVDGQVVLADVPVTFLLFLDKQLVALRRRRNRTRPTSRAASGPRSGCPGRCRPRRSASTGAASTRSLRR